jgi:AcrR family transcriptional regulator
MKKHREFEALDTRNKILAVAERLFAENGFEKVAVVDIARELGISQASLCRFFPAKSDMANCVVAKLLGDMDFRDAEAVPKDNLNSLLAALEQANAERFLRNSKLHELVETAFDECWPVVHDHIERLTARLAEIIAQGNRKGEFSVQDCVLAAKVVRIASTRSWHPRLMIEWGQEPDPTIALMIDVCLAAISHGALEHQTPPAKPTNTSLN